MKSLKYTIVFTLLLCVGTLAVAQDYSDYLNAALTLLDKGDCDNAERNYNVYKKLTGKSSALVEKGIAECNGAELQSAKVTKNNGVLLYTYMPDFYCDGIYDNDRNGHGLHTPNLDLNLDHFRITFSFKALSENGRYSWGSKYEDTGDYQWVIMQGSTRRLGLCLKSDGTILITTNNQDNFYQTNLTYSLNNYMNIDIEYDHGLLKINNNSFYIEMNKDYQYDKSFHSLNYSNGNAFYGYIKNLKIYTYPN